MFKFIIGILLFAVIIVFSIGAVGVGLLRKLLGFNKREQPTQQNYQQNPTEFDRKDKIFDKTEGEYVDFEEIEEE